MRLLLFVFSILHFVAQAQPAPIVGFKQIAYDFGSINEEDGIVSFAFDFGNNTDSILKVSDVKSECGCTTPNWTKLPIHPGDSGEIVVAFNPMNRPGSFQKHVDVVFEGVDSIFRIFVYGKVTPKQIDLKKRFPVKMGNLWTKHATLNLGNITNEQLIIRSFEVFNAGTKPMTIVDMQNQTTYLSVRVEPKIIPPASTANLIVTFNPTNEKLLGFNKDRITLLTDDTTNKEKSLAVTSSVTEYFGTIAESDSLKVPRAVLSAKLVDFKKVTEGSNHESVIMLQNIGSQPLKIRKVLSNCACVIATPTAMVIDPLDSIEITIKLQTTGRKGALTNFVNLFFNDPINPTQTITLKSIVD